VRPQVIVTYGEDHSGYPHPDHIRVHDISVAAFEQAGDPEAYPEAGEPFQPLKLYYTVCPQAAARHPCEVPRARLESPFDDSGSTARVTMDNITTSVDLTGYEDIRREALLAHATQVDPTSKFWFACRRRYAHDPIPSTTNRPGPQPGREAISRSPICSPGSEARVSS